MSLIILKKDEDLDAYRKRLQDRFGPVPRQGEELMQVVALRRVGKRLVVRRLFLSRDVCRCNLFLILIVSTIRVLAFDKVLNYIGYHPRRCNLKERNGKTFYGSQ